MIARLDQLVDPARVEVDVEGDAAAVLGQVLDRQAQTARPGGTEHQPVAALGEALVREGLAEELVVGLEVLDVDPALGQAGRAAGLEDVERPVGQPLRHPAPDRPAAQPLVLEMAEVGAGRRSSDLSRGSKSSFAAKSSQNGQPVSGSKCQATISRT